MILGSGTLCELPISQIETNIIGYIQFFKNSMINLKYLITFFLLCFVNTAAQSCPIDNCVYCENDICQACRKGYFYDSDNIKCQSCGNGCSNCSSNTECFDCFQGYSNQDNSSICLPQFEICPRMTYHIDGTFSNCGSCPDNCYICDDKKCNQCLPTYFLKDSQCKPCQSNCQLCLNADSCSKCLPGFSLYQDICRYQIEGIVGGTLPVILADGSQKIGLCEGVCEKCETISKCQQCPVGYFNNQGKCSLCNSQCKTCLNTNANNCTSCYKGSVLEDEKCFSEDSNCIEYQNKERCLLCSPRRYPNVNDGDCKHSCMNLCVKCVTGGQCIDCEPGYIVLRTLQGKISCVQCLYGCLLCDEADISNCITCHEGFYKNQNSYCLPCPENCKSCGQNNLTVSCLSCFTGYSLHEDNSCQPICKFPCATCIKGQPSSCQSCIAGYFLNSNSCINDIQCSNTLNCVACPRNFVLSNKKCQACTSSFTRCDSCLQTSLDTCTSCEIGYYLTSTSCVQCPSRCLACRNSNYCYKCKPGFYAQIVHKRITGKCLSCADGCLTCEYYSNNCLECQNEFWLHGKRCFSDDYIDARFSYLDDPKKVTQLTYEIKYAFINNVFGVTYYRTLFSNITYRQEKNQSEISLLLFNTSSTTISDMVSLFNSDIFTYYRFRYFSVKNSESCGVDKCVDCLHFNGTKGCVQCGSSTCSIIECTIQHCKFCAPTNNQYCLQCSDGYQLSDSNQCLPLNCQIENCTVCSQGKKNQCQTCNIGFTKTDDFKCKKKDGINSLALILGLSIGFGIAILVCIIVAIKKFVLKKPRYTVYGGNTDVRFQGTEAS